MPNIPLLREKGEMQVDVGTSTNSIHLSGDYAFSDQYALQVNGNLSYHNFSQRYDIFTDDNTARTGEMFTPDYDYGEFNHRYVEVGIGKYDMLKSNWKLELFTGVGCGSGFENVGDINSQYYLGFVQGNIGRKLKRHNFEFGFASRIAFSNFDLSYLDYTSKEKRNISFDNLHFEPAAFFRVGSQSIRFYGKAGLDLFDSFGSFDGINLARGIKHESINFTSVHLSIGVNYKFDEESIHRMFD